MNLNHSVSLGLFSSKYKTHFQVGVLWAALRKWDCGKFRAFKLMNYILLFSLTQTYLNLDAILT